ncbi:MAG TPA: hypothetical protein ENH31_03525, partial [Nitrospirae bacterium]|nr:hypothetical protein [Nitrospirota bacterium]
MSNKLILIPCVLILVLAASCGRRGDPVAITPYREVGVVKNLTTFTKNGKEYLRWGMPAGKDFPAEALKGFVVFRAELQAGETTKNCECSFRSLDLVPRDGSKTFEYLDKKAIRGKAYVYKIVVMDKNNRMGNDSNLVSVGRVALKPKAADTVLPEAPTGLTAVYTQK